MIKLNRGDKIAIVSLSSGILGEDFCRHQLILGKERLEAYDFEVIYMDHALKGVNYLRDHPEKRAEDLLEAFADPTIKGIICAIGGDDTFKLAPYLLTSSAKEIIHQHPKFFMGYSDTTINHLLLYKLGLHSFYGLSYLTCFADLGPDILAYSRQSFENILTEEPFVYEPSNLWYEEREDFSEQQLGIARLSHLDTKGYELLQGQSKFQGHLLGGCLESLYDLIVGERYPEEKEINQRYNLFPAKENWQGAILFLETSEERPLPSKVTEMLSVLNAEIDFEQLSGIIVGKPQNEIYYQEYKTIYQRIVPEHIPVVYNINFGHAYPKMLLQYGAIAQVNTDQQRIEIERL
ncbi:S66 family peptidase [Facklamia lactis]|uniref:S66 family peptidase n=1 Tax=Facklamia lactis TaxID=2749967 RepID=UPI0018CDECA5|nr:S66 peptidase family protein [Facklamia lactis]MBG9979749.1 LD-carboxypeptidase [Facklamia lactis]